MRSCAKASSLAWRASLTEGAGVPHVYSPTVLRVQGVYPPRYLSESEWIMVADLARTGAWVRSVAANLRRSASRISRELRRDADPGNGRYRPHAAQRMAKQRRARPRASKGDSDTLLPEQIISRLAWEWSPEQISRSLSLKFSGDCRMHVATERIYQALYPHGGNLHRQAREGCLRTGRY